MEKRNFQTSVSNLIAMCHIINHLEQFNNNFINFVSKKSNKNKVYVLDKICRGEFVLNSKGLQKFYQENKFVIDQINRICGIYPFIYHNYNMEDIPSCNSTFSFFYKYILEHKDDLDHVLNLLYKLKRLGFEELEFNENKDFSEDECFVKTTLSEVIGSDIVYMDNMELVPSYEDDTIHYRTTSSDYSIILKSSHKDISKYFRRIRVNSLLFDLDKLPESITKQTTYDEIIKLRENQKEKSSIIKTSVDLSVSIMDLYEQFNYTNRVIDRLDNIDKSELTEVLADVKNNLDKLQFISDKYDESVSELVSKEKLTLEKDLYMKRRYWSRVDEH